MNYIVKCYGGGIVFRPDTSRKRDEDDLYVPEFIDALSYSPVVYLKLDRPGKCIAKRFASRYYSTVGFGLLLYPEDIIASEGYASAICIDRLSCIPAEFQSLSCLGAGFALTKDSDPLFLCTRIDTSLLDGAIELASSRCFLRTGDVLAVELQARAALCRRADERCTLRGSIAQAENLAFNIIY